MRKSILKTFSIAFVASVLAASAFFVSCSSDSDSHEHTFATTYTTNETHHWYAATCEHNDEVKDKAEHSFGEWNDGKRSCSACNYEQACEHSFGEWSITEYSTEETEGKKEKECEVCNYKVEETIAKLDHTHAKGTHHEAAAGTCQKKGTIEHYDCVKETCEVKLDTDGNPLSSTEGEYGSHAFGTKHDAVAGTCKTKGTIEYHDCANEGCEVKLDVDGNTLSSTEGEVDGDNHTFGEYVSNDDFTWEDDGTKTRTCSGCSYQDTAIDVGSRDLFCERLYDAETNKLATASSKYIYFGVFPKTVLASDSSVAVDETEMKVMGANTYYKGNDGNYYAKVKENAYETGTQYKYTDGTQAKQRSASSYRYFKVEPIKWKVLTTNYNDTGKALLLAEDILTGNVPYYKYYLYSNKRTVGWDKNIEPNNYKYSQIRAYLNGLDYYYDESSTSTVKKTNYTGKGFLQIAFTSTAQSLIAETVVDNSADSTTDTGNHITKATSYACANTTDKIFLLSEKEVTTSAYGFAAYNEYGQGNARIRVPTDYAKANYAYQSSTTGYGGWWWLRSSDCHYNYYACDVYRDGEAYSNHYVDDFEGGVVPALSISLGN